VGQALKRLDLKLRHLAEQAISAVIVAETEMSLHAEGHLDHAAQV
jgi:hypothetical protein